MKMLKNIFIIFVFIISSIKGMANESDVLGNQLLKALGAYGDTVDIQKAKELINRGANVNAKSRTGGIPLFWAVKAGNKDLVALLISKNANLQPEENYIVREAVAQGNKDIVTLLLNAGADINNQDYEGHTALSEAVDQGNKDMVEFLLSKGAHVKGIAGGFALRKATTNREPEIIIVLLDNGVDVNATDADGDSALMLAVFSADPDKNIIKLLIDRGATIYAKDSKGKTIFDHPTVAEEIKFFVTTIFNAKFAQSITTLNTTLAQLQSVLSPL